MTWTCPYCNRDYPDSGISVPKDHVAADSEGCKVCWVSPPGTSRYVRPDSLEGFDEV